VHTPRWHAAVCAFVSPRRHGSWLSLRGRDPFSRKYLRKIRFLAPHEPGPGFGSHPVLATPRFILDNQASSGGHRAARIPRLAPSNALPELSTRAKLSRKRSAETFRDFPEFCARVSRNAVRGLQSRLILHHRVPVSGRILLEWRPRYIFRM